MPDVHRRIAMAQTRHGKMRHVWKSKQLHPRLKMRLYVSSVCSMMIYGSEAWTLTPAVKRALNGANSKMVAVITGRTIKEEAQSEGKTYDVVAGIRATRLRWLGHILRMPEKRMIHKTVKTLYANRAEGDLLMDAPATSSWEELKEMAFADEKKEWRRRVRAIKDTVNIQATKSGGKKRQRIKKNKKDNKGAKATKKENKKGASAAKATRAPSGGEASEEPSESEDEEWQRLKRTRKYKPLRGRIECVDGFTMSVQASSAHVCIPRNDHGPYTAVEVGYPSEMEPLLMPYSDGMSEICGGAPSMYANVPAEVIMDVVCKHFGLRSDSAHLPKLALPGADAAAATGAEEKESETEEERDENGCKWAAAAVPPTTSDESSVTSDERRSPYSMEHMGAPPPPPPPISQLLVMGSPMSPTSFMTTMTEPQTTVPTTTGELTPPQRLRQVEMSPIEKEDEN